VLIEPCYDSYVPAVQLAGGRPVFVTLRYPDYRIDWDEMRLALTPRTRVLVLNSPHNPTGMVLLEEDLRRLAVLLDGRPVVVLSDEVYEHLVFDGRRHESLARHPELAARTAVISSFGKSFHTTGWKVGYVAAPEAITTEIRRVHQFVTFAVNTPIQHAYAEFLERGVDFAGVTRFYEAKRDRFLALLEGSRFRPVPCRGTYFQLLDYSAIADDFGQTGPAAPPDARRDEGPAGGPSASGRAATVPHDVQMAMWLLKAHGVASIPTSAFLYASEAAPVLRFCFAKKDETLERAAERLRRV
jgi:methionine aminotransferase